MPSGDQANTNPIVVLGEGMAFIQGYLSTAQNTTAIAGALRWLGPASLFPTFAGNWIEQIDEGDALGSGPITLLERRLVA